MIFIHRRYIYLITFEKKKNVYNSPSVPDAFLGAVGTPDGPVQGHHVDGPAGWRWRAVHVRS